MIYFKASNIVVAPVYSIYTVYNGDNQVIFDIISLNGIHGIYKMRHNKIGAKTSEKFISALSEKFLSMLLHDSNETLQVLRVDEILKDM